MEWILCSYYVWLLNLRWSKILVRYFLRYATTKTQQVNIFCNVFHNFSKSSLSFFPNGVRIIFIAPEEKSSPLVAVGSSRQMRRRRMVRTNSPLISIFGFNFWQDSFSHWKVVTHFQCLCGGATSISGILKFVPHFEELWSWNFLWRSILISSS